MIQTQLLKADQPYQIISAAGQVGVQVATLIVTEDKLLEDGSYQIDTHSHPVVNYAVKEGLIEDLKYYNGDPDEEWKYFQRLQPEGAVWNKVEIRDIKVLGLVGANNLSVDMDTFVRLVPSVPSDDPSVTPGASPLWDMKTDSRIRNLRWALGRVGIKCSTWTQDLSNRIEHSEYYNVYLEIDRLACVEKFVRVLIREGQLDDWPYLEEISFRCRLEENPMECMYTIVRCMRELDELYIKGSNKLRFVYRQSSEKKDKWEDLLDRQTEHINSEVWKNRYGIG